MGDFNARLINPSINKKHFHQDHLDDFILKKMINKFNLVVGNFTESVENGTCILGYGDI